MMAIARVGDARVKHPSLNRTPASPCRRAAAHFGRKNCAATGSDFAHAALV
jgi:hypothetical protein